MSNSARRYEQHGLSFEYPANWELTEDRQGDEQLITLNTAGTAFLSFGLFFDHPDPQQVIETALQAYRDEYPNLDEYPVDSPLHDQPTMGMELEFFCLELVNTVQLRCCQTRDFTLLCLSQADDTEWEQAALQFSKVIESLECAFLDWNAEWKSAGDVQRPKTFRGLRRKAK